MGNSPAPPYLILAQVSSMECHLVKQQAFTAHGSGILGTQAQRVTRWFGEGPHPGLQVAMLTLYPHLTESRERE